MQSDSPASSGGVRRKPTWSRKRIRGLLQIAVSAVLFYFILRQVDWREVQAALLTFNLRWLGFAWVLFLLGIAIRAVRWQILLEALGLHRPLRELVTWYFAGSFFNVILPTGFGGDAVRAAELAQDTSRPGAVVNSVLVDRYLGIMVLLAMGLITGVARPDLAPTGILIATGVLFAGGLMVAWLLRRPWWKQWQSRPDGLGKFVRASRFAVLADAVTPYTWRTMLLGTAVALVFNILQIGWNIALAQGLGIHQPLAAFLVFIPLTAIALLLPAFGGLGVRELTYVGLFGTVGVARSAAMALSLGVYAITLASGVVGGLLYLWQGLRRVRRSAPTEK